MTSSSLSLRRGVVVAGFVICACLSGCSTPVAVSSHRPEMASSAADQGIADDGSIVPVELGVYGRRVEEYRAEPSLANTHQRRILYADALLHRGEVPAAIDLLVETELAYPDAYLNSLYLGLAYEMAGDLKTARHWVARTIERNGDVRGGSEWLHLAMLDARLALAEDPQWLRKNSVLANNTHRTVDTILDAIRIQLAVRGDFGLPPDLVVCDLYFEAGVCATGLSSRNEYFAQSLEISPLRLAEIQQQEKIRAKGQASMQVNY